MMRAGGEPEHEEISTDEVLSESVERVRSSRQLIDQIDERLQRSQRLLDDGYRSSAAG